MIKTIKGNLIKMAKDGKFDVIIHGCNCYHTMGGGIARSIKEEFPHAFLADQETAYGADKIGLFSMAVAKTRTHTAFTRKQVIIINAYTQFEMSNGEDVFEYEGFQTILRNLAALLPKDTVIGLPQIGAGLAGGDWNRILNIIQETIGHLDVTIVEYDGT